MDAVVADQEGGSSKHNKKPDSWKLPKIPVDQVYKTKAFGIFPSYTIKDFDETLILDSTALDSSTKSFSIVNKDFINSFKKKQHKFLHLGLVQVAVKPLARVRVGAPIVVCLTDHRLRDSKNSLLAVVETDLSDGPFYFNCFPSFSVSCLDKGNRDILNLSVKTSGIPLALTYRTVCKAMVDLNSEALEELVLDKTTFFQPNSESPKTTKWDEVQVPVPHEWIAAAGSQGMTADAEAVDEGVAGSVVKKKLDSWKLPRIPVDQVYEENPPIIHPILQKLKPFRSSSYVIKDFKKTVLLDSTSQVLQGKSFSLVNKNFMNWFQRKRHKFVHWGVVQVGIKPMAMLDGLEAPIVVCLRDNRMCDFKSSLLAVVETDLSKGPFHFNRYPSYMVPSTDVNCLVLSLHVDNDIPLALSLTYRIVCKATSNPFLFSSSNRQSKGETSYFQGDSELPKTTKWDEVQVSN